MKVSLSPRERKRVQNMRQDLTLSPTIASRSLVRAKVQVSDLIDVQHGRLLKMGDDNPKRPELEGSINALVEIQKVLQEAEDMVLVVLRNASKEVDLIIKGKDE